MTLRWKVSFFLCAAAAILVVSLPRRSEGSSSNKKEESRSDCDHILPLMMMLGAPPTASLPSAWLLGMLSLGVVVFLGNFHLPSGGGREENSGGDGKEEMKTNEHYSLQ